MSTKTLLIVGGVAVAAYVFMSRRSAAAHTANSAPGSNRNALIGSAIGAGTKILGAIFQTAGGSGRTGGTGTPTSSFVTSYDQLADAKVVGNGFVTSYD